MTRVFGALLALLMLVGVALPQEADGDDAPPRKSARKDSKAKAPPAPPGMAASGSKADGIEMPADMKVNYDEGFVPLQAVCKGPVKFIVIASQGIKVKFITNDAANTIIVSVPPQGGVISVYAIGLVENKLTDPVRTNILVAGPTPAPSPNPDPPPAPNPNPNPNPPNPNPPNPNPAPNSTVAGPLNVTFVLDLNGATPALAAVLNSQTLRKTITDNGNFFRVYDKSAPEVAKAGMDKVMQSLGATNALIIQRKDGSLAVTPTAIPASEAEVVAKVRQAGGIK